MKTLTISSKHQVVIPKKIRESLHLMPDQKMQAIVCRGRIELVLLRPVQELHGFLAGIDTCIEREDERE